MCPPWWKVYKEKVQKDRHQSTTPFYVGCALLCLFVKPHLHLEPINIPIVGRGLHLISILSESWSLILFWMLDWIIEVLASIMDITDCSTMKTENVEISSLSLSLHGCVMADAAAAAVHTSLIFHMPYGDHILCHQWMLHLWHLRAWCFFFIPY